MYVLRYVLVYGIRDIYRVINEEKATLASHISTDSIHPGITEPNLIQIGPSLAISRL